MASSAASSITSIREIWLYIRNNLNSGEFEDLVFLKELPDREEEEAFKSPRYFWSYMLKTGKYSEDDLGELFSDLHKIGRGDLYIQAKNKHDQFMQYKSSQEKGTPQTVQGPGTSSPNQLSPASPDRDTNITQGIVHQPGLTSPNPAQYTSPVPGLAANTFQVPGPTTGPTPGQAVTSVYGPAPYTSPGPGQGQAPNVAQAPEPAPNIHPAQRPNVPKYPGEPPITTHHHPPSPGSSPISRAHNTLQVSQGGNIHGADDGLRSNEPLRTMDSNLVLRKGSPSNQGPAGLVHVQEISGQGISSPGSLHSNESEGYRQRNVGQQPSSTKAEPGFNGPQLPHTTPGAGVPVQGAAGLAHQGLPSPGDSHSVISTASSLKSDEHSGAGQLGMVGLQKPPTRSMPQPLKTCNPGGISQLTSSQIQISKQAGASSSEAASDAKHTLPHPVQPASTPDHLRDEMQRLGNLTLEEAEQMASNSSQQQHVIGQGDTVKDGPTAATGGDLLAVDVVTDSASDDATMKDKQPQGAEALLASLFDVGQPREQKKTIKLRNYQEELAEPGIKGVNYVICAPTGSGKTITAAHICHTNMMKMKKDGRDAEFKAIFIVPTRHLKKQQRDGFQDIFIPGQVTSLAEGQLFSDAFGKGNVKVLMITAQVLVNALMQKDFRLTDASMLVFDECHHTTLNHPYNEIMRQYLKDKKAVLRERGVPVERWPVGRPDGRLPQVVGLTASVGTGTSDDAHSHIVTLCANLDSYGVKIVTDQENLEFLNECNKPPEKDIIKAMSKRTPTPNSKRFIEILETILEEIENNVLVKHRSVLKDAPGISEYSPRRGTQEYENWAAKIRVHAEIRFPDLEICANYLFRLNLGLLLYEDLRAIDALESIEIFKMQTKGREDDLPDGRHCRLIYEKDLQELKEIASLENPLSNPKLLCLHELIKKMYSKEPNSIGIVLARTRFATYALLNFIKSCEELQELSRPIRPVRIVGQSKETDQGQTLAKQEGALADFKSGRANLLVATDIVQEGLDIPACNVIIRYNFVSNEIGTVQSKGRARKEGSQCFLIVEEGSTNEKREMKNRESVEEMDKAIREANNLRKEEWLKQIRDRQLSIIAQIEERDEVKRLQQEESKQVEVKLLCLNCEKFICKASDLERRLANYTCLDETIAERTKTIRTGVKEFRESRTVGILKCLCGYQLGQALEFKRLHQWKPGYNLSPKSFYFMFNDDRKNKQVFAKWKKVNFAIATEE